MKVLLTAWLIYGGAVVPESITTQTFTSVAECIAKGQYVTGYFDGKKTYHTAKYVCTEARVEA